MKRYEVGCFHVEEKPENLCDNREREIQLALREYGLAYGVICYQIVDGIALIMLYGSLMGHYDLAEHDFLSSEEVYDKKRVC